MNLRKKRKELHAVAGTPGVVVILAGFVGGWFSVTTTIVLSFAVWAVGATLVNVFTDRPGSDAD